MTTRRRAFLMTVASIGAMGSVGALTTVASATPEPSTPAATLGSWPEALTAIRAENERLQAELEDEKALTAGLERINHALQLKFEQLRAEQAPGPYYETACELLAQNTWMRGALHEIATQQDEGWWRLKAAEALGRANTTSRYQLRAARAAVKRLAIERGDVALF